MAANLIAWGISQVVRMHTVKKETTTVPDPHARWRDLVVRDSPTATYRQGRCGQCRDDGTCDLFDAAQEYAATVFPLLSAEEIPDSQPSL